MHENRETSCTSGSQRARPVREGHKPNGGHERSGGVGLRRSTDEPAEQRGAIFGGGWGGKGADQGEHRSVPHEPDTERGTSVPGIERCATSSKERKQERFTALLHHLSVDLLRDSFYALKRQAAPGVDGVTWKEYETGLEDRIADLHSRVHRGAYRAQPSRRVYIPKADGRQRPLGIAALEDKIVQQAVVTILNQIYEVDFKGFSYGFRPGRSPHQALDALTVGIQRKRVNWVLDADIRGFFDNLIARMDIKVCRAPRGRPPDTPPDPEMVEGGSIGRWPMVGDEGRDSARGSGFTAAGERVPALRLRSMGGSLAQESGEGRCDCRPLRRRSGGGFQHRTEAERFLRSFGNGWRSSVWNYIRRRRD